MHRPDPIKDKAGMRAGYVGEAEIQRGLNKADFAPHCPTIAQRRADSIRLQALGQQIGGA